MWWQVLVGAGTAVLALWLVLLVVLWRLRPDELTAREALRLLPDVLRLVSRLARDASLPRGLRLRLWLLLGYLAVPFDLVPDIIPVIGYADDVVLVMVVLRAVLRRAGLPALQRNWPGTPAGLDVVLTLVGERRRQPSPGSRKNRRRLRGRATAPMPNQQALTHSRRLTRPDASPHVRFW